MRYLAILIAFAIGTAISIISPVYAAAFYIWNNTFRPLDFAFMADRFSAANYVTIVLVISFGYHLLTGKYRLHFNLGALFIGCFLAWTGISAFFAPSQIAAWDGYILVLKYLAPLFFISMCFRNLRDIDFFTSALGISVGIWGAQAGLHGAIKLGPIIDIGIPGSQMAERNDFVVALLIALPLLVYLFAYYQGPLKKFVRILLFFLLILNTIAIPLSLSRGGMLGLICALLFVAMLSKKRIRNLSLILILGPIIFFSTPSFVLERMHTIKIGSEQQEESAKSRMGNMYAGVLMARDYAATGVGPFCFINFVSDYSPEHLEPHSIWIKAGAELGVPGLLIYILIILLLIYKLWKMYVYHYAKDRKIAHAAIAFICAFIGFNASATFSNKLYSEYQWALIATAGAFTRFDSRKKTITKVNSTSIH